MIPNDTTARHVLVIGAYGLIGQGVAERLIADGFGVTGLGRNARTALRVLPSINWIEHDLRTLTDAADWHPILKGVTTVANCSGALQDGADDDLEAIHHRAVSALAKACAEKNISLIQVSAVGAAPEASTRFLASKGRGDAAIRASGVAWHIFRPGLVLAANAYGGTALLRMLSAVPVLQPIALPEARLQTVSLDYVAKVVSAAAQGTIPQGFEADLVEKDAHSLRALVTALRHWLCFPPARFQVVLPSLLVTPIARIADALSWLGWRSPLRSSAMTVLRDGVLGTSAELDRFGLPPAPSLHQTLNTLRAGPQDRLSARMALLFPLVLVALSLFWLASGIIGLIRLPEAARVLQDAGWSSGLASTSVVFWSLADIAIGLAFAIRKYAPMACWAAIAVSLFYLLASTLVAPALWLDPLGPLIKIIPAIVLALVARALLETR